MVKELESKSSIIEVMNTIKKMFESYNNDLYLPVIFKEGHFTYNSFENKDNKPSSEFYSKLIIRPRNSKITHSWMLNNLAYSFFNGTEFLEKQQINNSDFIYNLIVLKKVYNNSIYTFNPMLYNDNSYISEENYKNNEIANLYYCDDFHKEQKIPVLKKENNNIYLFKKVLEDYLVASEHSREESDYVLTVEFEYRNTNRHIIDTENYQDNNSFVDNIATKNNEFLWLIGTFDIPLVINKEAPLSIIVNDLSGKKRKINEKNYNDDTEAGLIVFSNKCFEYLKKRYIILGLTMIDTYNDNQSYIIDTLNNIFVFWEGEFNKLPREVKLELEKYNDKERNESLISPAMFEWQLNSSWDWKPKAYPCQLLGDYLIENYIELVREYKCNVILPYNIDIFVNEMKNILNILSLKIEDIAEPENGYGILVKIYNKDKVQLNEEKMYSLFQYFCSLVLEKVDKEYVRELPKTNQ